MWTQMARPCLCTARPGAPHAACASRNTLTASSKSSAGPAERPLPGHAASFVRTCCKASNGAASTAVADPDAPSMLTGAMCDTTAGATNPFSDVHLDAPKQIVIVRHGQTDWNLSKRMQVGP